MKLGESTARIGGHMSQYSNPQTATKCEQAASQGGSAPESAHPNTFNGKSQDNKNPKLGPVSAGHSSKVGKTY